MATKYRCRFEVTIKETLQRVVAVEADSADEAEQTAKGNWLTGDYILGADDFADVEFSIKSIDQCP